MMEEEKKEEQEREWQNEEIEFVVSCKMKRRWAQAFVSMLEYMEFCGKVGHSSDVGMFADGDGDYRPEFTVKGFKLFDGKLNPPCPGSYGHSNVVFDADFTLDRLEYYKGDGQQYLDENQKWGVKQMVKDGWDDWRPMKK